MWDSEIGLPPKKTMLAEWSADWCQFVVYTWKLQNLLNIHNFRKC